MALTGAFYGIPAAQLTTMLAEWQACLSAIAGGGQSYTIAGRQFNRANLPEVRQTILEINTALARAQGTRTTQTFANFSR